MQYELVYKQPAVRQIQRLPPQIRKRLKSKLEWLASQKAPLNFAAALTKPADAQYRFRVGNYRVLLDVDGKTFIILMVQHRREVYRRK